MCIYESSQHPAVYLFNYFQFSSAVSTAEDPAAPPPSTLRIRPTQTGSAVGRPLCPMEGARPGPGWARQEAWGRAWRQTGRHA
eukprot:scaffold107174_cov54-Phaeocystis_antarctica.AAC.1